MRFRALSVLLLVVTLSVTVSAYAAAFTQLPPGFVDENGC